MMILKLSFTSTSPSLVIASFFHFWKWNYSYEPPSGGKTRLDGVITNFVTLKKTHYFLLLGSELCHQR